MKTIKPLKVMLIGHGKMGKAIEEQAQLRGHSLVALVSDRHSDIGSICRSFRPDVAFEFTSPRSAKANLDALIEAGIPVVCGSTGWLDDWNAVVEWVEEKSGSLFYAANYSIGMNLMFAMTDLAASWMEILPEYEIHLREIHHTEKQDKPSGTALHLAQQVIDKVSRKKNWSLTEESKGKVLGIEALREPGVPGTHELRFDSEADSLQIIHTAHSRKGFALGAVMAAEWLGNRKGVFGMEDLLKDLLRKAGTKP